MDRVYISGVMTGIKDDNRPLFEEVAEAARQHLKMETFIPGDMLATKADTLALDLAAIRGCSDIVFLPGWHLSENGALIEYLWADIVGTRKWVAGKNKDGRWSFMQTHAPFQEAFMAAVGHMGGVQWMQETKCPDFERPDTMHSVMKQLPTQGGADHARAAELERAHRENGATSGIKYWDCGTSAPLPPLVSNEEFLECQRRITEYQHKYQQELVAKAADKRAHQAALARIKELESKLLKSKAEVEDLKHKFDKVWDDANDYCNEIHDLKKALRFARRRNEELEAAAHTMVNLVTPKDKGSD